MRKKLNLREAFDVAPTKMDGEGVCTDNQMFARPGDTPVMTLNQLFDAGADSAVANQQHSGRAGLGDNRNYRRGARGLSVKVK